MAKKNIIEIHTVCVVKIFKIRALINNFISNEKNEIFCKIFSCGLTSYLKFLKKNKLKP